MMAELPSHLADMALFKVNPGTREREVCALRWDWEHDFPELKVSVFVVPAAIVKNKQDRLIMLNDVATKVIDSRRGRHATHVFTFRGQPVRRLHNTAWRHARDKAGLPTLRVHDLKHRFGRRLRAAGVSFEDRQDLLGHKSGRITTHYSAAKIGNLIEAENPVIRSRKTPETVHNTKAKPFGHKRTVRWDLQPESPVAHSPYTPAPTYSTSSPTLTFLT